MSDKIFKLGRSFGDLASGCVRGVTRKSEMEGKICTLLVDLQSYHQDYSEGVLKRAERAEAMLRELEAKR
jgi:hypothetical protein